MRTPRTFRLLTICSAVAVSAVLACHGYTAPKPPPPPPPPPGGQPPPPPPPPPPGYPVHGANRSADSVVRR